MESNTTRIRTFAAKLGFIVALSLSLIACGTVNTSSKNGLEKNIHQIDVVSYLCDEQKLDVYFHAEDAQLIWQSNEYVLTRAVSASGAFYLGEGVSFWAHNDEAQLTVQERHSIPCQLLLIES